LLAINPEITNWIGFSIFYAALFLATSGTAALAGFTVRFLLLKQELAFRLVKEAFRQSLLIAVLVVASLILLSQGMLNWLNALALALALSALEYLLLSLEPRRPLSSANVVIDTAGKDN
jgi:hypothetical protein